MTNTTVIPTSNEHAGRVENLRYMNMDARNYANFMKSDLRRYLDYKKTAARIMRGMRESGMRGMRDSGKWAKIKDKLNYARQYRVSYRHRKDSHDNIIERIQSLKDEIDCIELPEYIESGTSFQDGIGMVSLFNIEKFTLNVMMDDGMSAIAELHQHERIPQTTEALSRITLNTYQFSAPDAGQSLEDRIMYCVSELRRIEKSYQDNLEAERQAARALLEQQEREREERRRERRDSERESLMEMLRGGSPDNENATRATPRPPVMQPTVPPMVDIGGDPFEEITTTNATARFETDGLIARAETPTDFEAFEEAVAEMPAGDAPF